MSSAGKTEGRDRLDPHYSSRTRPTSILAMAVTMVLWATCLQSACAERQIPAGKGIGLVEQLHAAWEQGDRATVHRLVDYRYRLAEMLGPLWVEADDPARVDAIALAQAMFENTTERYWTSHHMGRKTEIRVASRSTPHLWMVSHASGGAQPDLYWRYRLTATPAGLRVTQREFSVGVGRSDTGVFYPMAVREIAGRYGRQPTLAELNANLPSLLGRLRARTVKIPELPNTPSRPAPTPQGTP
ncbi:MAG: hypothetical protein ACI9MR_001134 [Myxococcota bacterium]|jgi:hypothetical protein